MALEKKNKTPSIERNHYSSLLNDAYLLSNLEKYLRSRRYVYFLPSYAVLYLLKIYNPHSHLFIHCIRDLLEESIYFDHFQLNCILYFLVCLILTRRNTKVTLEFIKTFKNSLNDLIWYMNY